MSLLCLRRALESFGLSVGGPRVLFDPKLPRILIESVGRCLAASANAKSFWFERADCDAFNPFALSCPSMPVVAPQRGCVGTECATPENNQQDLKLSVGQQIKILDQGIWDPSPAIGDITGKAFCGHGEILNAEDRQRNGRFVLAFAGGNA